MTTLHIVQIVATTIHLVCSFAYFYLGYKLVKTRKLYQQSIEAQQQSMFIRQFTDDLSSHLFKRPPMH